MSAMEVEQQEAGNERQAGHGTRAMDYGGPDFRMAVTPLAQKLGESVEGLAALASALAEANVAVLGPGSSYAVVGALSIPVGLIYLSAVVGIEATQDLADALVVLDGFRCETRGFVGTGFLGVGTGVRLF